MEDPGGEKSSRSPGEHAAKKVDRETLEPRHEQPWRRTHDEPDGTGRPPRPQRVGPEHDERYPGERARDDPVHSTPSGDDGQVAGDAEDDHSRWQSRKKRIRTKPTWPMTAPPIRPNSSDRPR